MALILRGGGDDNNRAGKGRDTVVAGAGDEVEIVSGVAVSDRIVTSGQFLLDAEASLQSGLARMAAGPSPAMDGTSP